LREKWFRRVEKQTNGVIIHYEATGILGMTPTVVMGHAGAY
jgi:hypothetical protein